MKSLIATICILGLVGMVVGVAAQAVDTGTVSATVTPQKISVTVSPVSVAYGIVQVPSSDNIPTGDTIVSANNDGNVTETFNIKGANAAGTIPWTIVDGAPGGAASYNYNHKFLDCGVGDSTCTTVDAANNMTAAYETLEAGVGVGSSDYFKLRLSTPTETGSDFSEHSTTVTVQATI